MRWGKIVERGKNGEDLEKRLAGGGVRREGAESETDRTCSLGRGGNKKGLQLQIQEKSGGGNCRDPGLPRTSAQAGEKGGRKGLWLLALRRR